MFDLALVDDDPLIQEIWQIAAAECGKALIVANDPSALAGQNVNRDTPIFVDLYSGTELVGIAFLEQLHTAGFQNLFVTTGAEPESLPLPHFVKGIIGKEFPESLISVHNSNFGEFA